MNQPDPLAQFRGMLVGGDNTAAASPSGGTNSPAGGDFGGGGNIPGGGFGGGGGMDPWQHTVETRLSSLDGRAGKIEDRLGKLETSLATLTERVSHLPTKGWAVTGIVTSLMIIAALIGYTEKIQALLGQAN